MYARTNRCYNVQGSRTNYVRSSIPHCIRQTRRFLWNVLSFNWVAVVLFPQLVHMANIRSQAHFTITCLATHHPTCSMILTVHVQVTRLMVKHTTVVGTQPQVSTWQVKKNIGDSSDLSHSPTAGYSKYWQTCTCQTQQILSVRST
jgi:hypothetical protein